MCLLQCLGTVCRKFQGLWAPAEAACDLVGVTRRGLHAVFAVFLSIADSNFGI